MNDYQQNQAYDWESNCILPKYVDRYGNLLVRYAEMYHIVERVWKNAGFSNPPRIKTFSNPYNIICASASRELIYLPELAPRNIVYHEVVHSLLIELNRCDFHGPIFLGTFIKVLVKYLQEDLERLCKSAKEYGLDFNLAAQPLFLD